MLKASSLELSAGNKAIAFKQADALSLEGLSNLSATRVQVLSDTHLNVPLRKRISEEDGDNFHLLKYLRKINQEIEKQSSDQAEVLVFNGDTFEIIGACAGHEQGHLPYLANGDLHKADLTRKVIENILSANEEICTELKRFLGFSRNNKIVFIKGNHDAYLAKDIEAQKIISRKLSGNEVSKQIAFGSELKIPELKFYARHGQDLDEFNYADDKLTAGDLLTYVAHKLTKAALGKINALRKEFDKSAKPIIDEFEQQVENISNLRPLSTFWVYMDKLVSKYSRQAADIKYLPKALRKIGDDFYKSFHTIVDDESFKQQFRNICVPKPLRWLSKRLFEIIPKTIQDWTISNEAMQKFLIKVISTIKDWFTDSNKVQRKTAERIASEYPDLKVIAFGHTHKQSDKRDFARSLGDEKHREYRYVNTDSWSPVIYARAVSDENIKFLREEHPSGVFTIEYKAPDNGKPAEAVYTSSFYTAVKTKL